MSRKKFAMRTRLLSAQRDEGYRRAARKRKRLVAIGRAEWVSTISISTPPRARRAVMNTPAGTPSAWPSTHDAAPGHGASRGAGRRFHESREVGKKKIYGKRIARQNARLIGLGTIGTEVARLAQSHKMTVVAFDPYVSKVLANEQNIRLLPIGEVLKASDFISLHCSLTPETTHLINAKNIALMKKGVAS